MQKILPCQLEIEFAKNQLGPSIFGDQEIDSFRTIEYIKKSLEEYFVLQENKIKLHRFGKKLLGMDEEVELGSHNGESYIFIKLKGGNQRMFEDREKVMVDMNGDILFSTSKGMHELEDYFTFIRISKIEEDTHFLKIYGSVYIQTRGVKMIRSDIEDLLRNIVYRKKPSIVRMDTYFTEKDIKEFENEIQDIEVFGTFGPKSGFLDLSNINKNNREKLKTGIFIRCGKGTPIHQSIRNKELQAMFINKPEAKARVYVGDSTQNVDFDLETLKVLMKQDTASTREYFDYFTFKKDCLGHAFGIGRTSGIIE